jgi:hypothetical protein
VSDLRSQKAGQCVCSFPLDPCPNLETSSPHAPHPGLVDLAYKSMRSGRSKNSQLSFARSVVFQCV